MARATDPIMVRDVILSIFPDHSLEKEGQEIYVPCVYCGTDKKKLAINPAKGVFQCWRCEERGPVMKLFNHLKALGLIEEKDLENILANNAVNNLIIKDKYNSQLRKNSAVEERLWTPQIPCVFPSGIVPLYGWAPRTSMHKKVQQRAFKYLSKRSVPLKFIEKFKVHVCIKVDSPYFMHLFFPVLDIYGRQMKFWTTRTLRDSKPKTFHSGAKYSRYKAKGILANEHIINGSSEVALCEGPFDAFSIHSVMDLPACPMFGKRLHNYHIHRLKELEIKTVYICLDPDAHSHIANIRERLSAHGFNPLVVELTDGDPNEVSPEVLKKAFASVRSSWNEPYSLAKPLWI